MRRGRKKKGLLKGKEEGEEKTPWELCSYKHARSVVQAVNQHTLKTKK